MSNFNATESAPPITRRTRWPP